MSEQDKDGEQPKYKITFAPGCFDDFEGTQEELDEMVAQLKDLFASGELLENSVEINSDDILESINAAEEYGVDENGFLKYPFTANTRH